MGLDAIVVFLNKSKIVPFELVYDELVEKRKVFNEKSLVALVVLPDRLYKRIIDFFTSLKVPPGASDNLLFKDDVLVITFIKVKSVNGVTSSCHLFVDLRQVLCVRLFESCWAEALAVW